MPSIEIPEPVFLDRLGGDEVYGFGQDGNVTITADTSLSRDMYYNDLTINANCTLDSNGYRIFVKGTLTFTNSTSRIGRFTNKTTVGTLKGGFAKGTAATDTLGGKSGEQNQSDHDNNQFFSGENEFFNLSVAIQGSKFDPASGTYKFIGGGSGGSDGSITANAQAGADGGDSNWSDYQTVGAPGGKGATGNAATAGTGAVGGGVVLVIAKTIVGDGTIRADGDSASAGSDGSSGAPAPDASTPGNTVPGNNYSYPGNNYSYGYSYPGNNYSYPGNNYSYTSPGNNYSYSGSNPHTHYHWHPSPPINNFATGFYHYHYAHSHPYTNYGSNNPTTNYGSNNTNYGSNNTNYGANYGSNNPNNATNPSNTNPTVYHPGGAGGSGGTASDGYNAGGGTVILISGTKPLPSGLTTAAAAGTSGTGTAGAGTVVTVFNIAASDTDPGA